MGEDRITDLFACGACDAALTAPVSRVVLPDHARQLCQHDFLPPLLESGSYAVDPEPCGPPWRAWDELSAAAAKALGIHGRVLAVPDGERGAIVLAPGDAHGVALIPGHYEGYCMGIGGGEGPNLACARCGQVVGSRVDDCSFWQEVRLLPSAVRQLTGVGPTRPIVPWEALRQEYAPMPPVEQRGYWDPRWQAAVAVALAHLLVASEGNAVDLPPGPVTTAFGRAVAGLLPAGPPARTLRLAGPGLRTSVADIALVPRHPQTGEVWTPSNAPRAAAVPLAAEVWLRLAFGGETSRLPVTGGLPAGVERDDPLPLRPTWPFQPDWSVFQHTLVRLPAVREPWLAAINDRAASRPYGAPY